MLIKQGKTNWKYLVIVALLASLAGGGILGYYYRWSEIEKSELSEMETSKKEEESKSPERVQCETGKEYKSDECECPEDTSFHWFSKEGRQGWFKICKPSYVKTSIVDWEIYSPSECKFLIKYPPELDKYVYPEERCHVIFIIYGPGMVGDRDLTSGLVVGVSIKENLSNLSLKEFAQKAVDDSKDSFYPLSALSLQTVGGISGYKAIDDWAIESNDPAYTNVYLPYGADVLIIEAMHVGPLKSEYIAVFDQMLSTFRFLE